MGKALHDAASRPVIRFRAYDHDTFQTTKAEPDGALRRFQTYRADFRARELETRAVNGEHFFVGERGLCPRRDPCNCEATHEFPRSVYSTGGI